MHGANLLHQHLSLWQIYPATFCVCTLANGLRRFLSREYSARKRDSTNTPGLTVSLNEPIPRASRRIVGSTWRCVGGVKLNLLRSACTAADLKHQTRIGLHVELDARPKFASIKPPAGGKLCPYRCCRIRLCPLIPADSQHGFLSHGLFPLCALPYSYRGNQYVLSAVLWVDCVIGANAAGGIIVKTVATTRVDIRPANFLATAAPLRSQGEPNVRSKVTAFGEQSRTSTDDPCTVLRRFLQIVLRLCADTAGRSLPRSGASDRTAFHGEVRRSASALLKSHQVAQRRLLATDLDEDCRRRGQADASE
jgi:hypothetical protein